MKSSSLFLIIAVFLAGCAPAPAVKPLASQGGIEIIQAVVRLPGDASTGRKNDAATLAGYITMRNTGSSADTLLGVQADFAGLSMLHESFVDSNGVAGMNMVTAIVIPAGQQLELKPGGFHVMFVGLKQDLKVGERVTVILQFQKAGAIRVAAQVTDQ